MSVVRRLSQDSGFGVSLCKSALSKCGQDYCVALEYLRLKAVAVNRRKCVDGQLVPWEDSDFISEAIRRAKDR